jgi:integration host factor subunit alpha
MMIKSDLEDRLVEVGAVYTRKEAQDLVEMVFSIVKRTLASGEDLKLSGFGNFIVRDKVARLGRNPKTGEQIEIEARRVVRFKTSVVLKKELNATAK